MEPLDPLIKQKDLEAWRRWKQSKSITDLELLLKQMDNVIHRQIANQKGSIPDIVLELKAKEYAKQAFETYDPKMNVALSTHVFNNLKQLSRLNMTYKSAVRAPEHQQRVVGDFISAKQLLKDELGRPATSEELADHLKWNVKEIARLESTTRAELSDSLPMGHELESSFSNAQEDVDPMVIYFYKELSPQDKLLFEYTTGYGGKPVLSNQALADKLKISYSQLSYKRKLLIDKLKQRMSQYGHRVY